MSVKIRLQRFGTKDKPSFRIIATDSQKKRNGRALAYLGFYDPKTKPPTFKIDRKELDRWVGWGAKLSTTVAKLTYPKAV